jgi:hypothetical protein
MIHDLARRDHCQLAGLILGEGLRILQETRAGIAGFDQRQHIGIRLASERGRNLTKIDDTVIIEREAEAVAILPAEAQEFQGRCPGRYC